jgi:methionyl-tRNA formyltransferase
VDTNNKKLNFVFWGTPDVASETLDILKDAGYIPTFIVTSPDRPQGRKMLLTPPPVKIWADENNITCLQPEKFEDEIEAIIKNGSSFDLFIVVAYGKIMPENILSIPKLGSINIHYSLLPKYRGASPVESAILNGDTETGVTIQKMIYKMDAGDIIAVEKIKIGETEKTSELRARLIKIGGELLVKTLPKIIEKKIKLTAQDEKMASYCKKIIKENGFINLEDDGIKNYNKFRAYATWPRTFFFKNEKRIIITDAVLIDLKFVIKKVLPEGKKEIKYEDFLRSNI